MTRHTQFGVVVIESINYLLIVVFEWTSGDWYEHVTLCGCVYARARTCVCVVYM